MLATSLGVRGIGALPDEHYIAENDIEKFSGRLREVLSDLSRYERIRENARNLGRAYDFREVFKAYVQSYGSDMSSSEGSNEEHLFDGFEELIPRVARQPDPELVQFLAQRIDLARLEVDHARLWQRLIQFKAGPLGEQANEMQSG